MDYRIKDAQSNNPKIPQIPIQTNKAIDKMKHRMTQEIETIQKINISLMDKSKKQIFAKNIPSSLNPVNPNSDH